MTVVAVADRLTVALIDKASDKAIRAWGVRECFMVFLLG
jgi:hypothetical protein